MHSEICVAGWSLEEKRMVRPLSGPGCHWSPKLANPKMFQMGNVIEVTPTNMKNPRGLPHAHEDLIVEGTPKLLKTILESEVAAVLSDSESPSMAALFADNLQENRFVMRDSDCPSLGAIRVDCDSIQFFEETWDDRVKLRCRLRDASGQWFNLPVVSVPLSDLHEDKGVRGLNALVKKHEAAHVRIGLAHPMENGRAFAMVNNMAFY